MYETCNLSPIQQLKVNLHHSRAADSTISTVGITTVKSMIESSSLRSTSLVDSDMEDPPAGVLSKHWRWDLYCLTTLSAVLPSAPASYAAMFA